MKNLSVEHSAKIIGVSAATLRNWVKAGHIHPSSTRPLSFCEESVLNLKNKVGSESFDKLKTRANKRGSTNAFIPEEYADNTELVTTIADIVAYAKQKDLAVSPIVFLAALRLLEAEKEVQRLNDNALFNVDDYTDCRQSVKTILLEWRKALGNIQNTEHYATLRFGNIFHTSTDFLGLLYQSLACEGSKSEQGSYYTPSSIVEESLAQINKPINTFLDPCCGTGKYLVLAAKNFKLEPHNVLGFDCDATAVYIAKLNLLLQYRSIEFTPQIFCLDAVTELATGELFCETNHLLGSIDAIATNPPWGAYKNALVMPQGSQITSGESFSIFLEKSLNLLKSGGFLSFILPESILTVRTHADIRKLLLNTAKVQSIALLGRCFTGVFSPVIRLDLIKEAPEKEWSLKVQEGKVCRHVLQNRFNHNHHCTFDVKTVSEDVALLEKIYSVKHKTLANHAEWALGIVTGDNARFVFNTQVKDSEPVFRGSDVLPYHMGEARSFIYFQPDNFQQVAPEKYFRAQEKLIYKFISNRLVFAYDDQQRLTLNSANILIPSIPNLSIKVALAFLNSTLFQYIFLKKFSTHKVLRGDLEKLPFPVVTTELQPTLEHLVNEAILLGRMPAKVDDMVFSLFQLTEHDINLIKRTVQA